MNITSETIKKYHLHLSHSEILWLKELFNETTFAQKSAHAENMRAALNHATRQPTGDPR